jgi:site-specific DNA-methyltransferase (adenine-specific)
MLRHIITASSKPGAVVLDAFMGGGSTGRACLLEDRFFIGIEKSPKYYQQAEHLLEAETLPLFAEIFA